MSDTPKVDAEAFPVTSDAPNQYVHANFARQLERELNQLRAEVQELRRQDEIWDKSSLTNTVEENERLRAEIERLKTVAPDGGLSPNWHMALDMALKERDQWRECAEKLAKVVQLVSYDSWKHPDFCVRGEEALALYHRLKEEKK